VTRRTLLALLALVLAACGGDDQAAPTTSATSTTPSTATSTTGTPTTTGPTTAEGCGAVSTPAGATQVTTAAGDVDGDGQDDVLASYVLGDAEAHVQVSLAAGGGDDAVVSTFSGTPAVSVLGGADVDGDGADEVWLRTGFGASASIVGLARVTGCQLAQVTWAGGDPVELAVGGGVGSASGVACDGRGDADLTAYSANSDDGTEYDITATDYALEGTTLVQTAVEAITASAGDSAFARATGFVCDGLSL
jgi:hypothetical protein